jgi:hypothetical protein
MIVYLPLLNQFGGESQVVFRSGRMGIIEQSGFAVARALAQANVPVNDSAKNMVGKVAPGFLDNLVG